MIKQIMYELVRDLSYHLLKLLKLQFQLSTTK